MSGRDGQLLVLGELRQIAEWRPPAWSRAFGLAALFLEMLDLGLMLLRTPLLPPRNESGEHQRVCAKPSTWLVFTGV
jgi:hypothetical protein